MVESKKVAKNLKTVESKKVAEKSENQRLKAKKLLKSLKTSGWKQKRYSGKMSLNQNNVKLNFKIKTLRLL